MRVLNIFLRFILTSLFVLLIGGAMRAQNPVNQPDAIDAAMDGIIGGTTGTIVYPEPIAIGDTLAVCVYSDTAGGGASGTYPVTDSLGNTYTLSSVALTPGVTNPTNVYIEYTTSAFAGADTITMAPGSAYGSIQAARFQHLSGVVDASSTTTASGSSSITQMSTSTTTTINGDLLVSCAAAGGGGDRHILPSDNEYLLNQDIQGQPLITQAHTTTKGVKSQTFNIWGSGATFGAVTLAMKPTPSIYIADAALPDAAPSIAYSAQLHGIGGTAAYTYACTGLPANGLSLNTSTGVISGSTPTAGTLSLGCTVTDGTITSATNTLSLLIGSTSFLTPTIRNIVTGNYDAGTTISIPGVACGNIIVLTLTGDDTHNRSGWIQAVSGTNNYIRDSYSSPVVRVTPHGGAFSSPLVTYFIGPVMTSGTDVITVVNNQNSSSGNEALLMSISGVQASVDTGAVNANMFLSGSGTLNTSLTTVVPGEFLFDTSMNGGFGGGFSTFTIGAPFGVNSLSGDLLAASSNIGTAGSTTAAVSFTSGSSIDALASSLWALRPALQLAACPVATGLGEKIRRQSW